MVLRQTLALLAVGLVAGLPMALLAAQLVRSQLFGVGAVDAVSFIEAVCVLVVAAACAAVVPARRATRVDPVVALRTE